ncbi:MULTISPECIES: phosphoethanolamine transferase [unclassified Duganella]|uniref:phosphoethanolamine transferase n=1 Tax=unclassified Duganella TaxID=2636909 RepID=UPI000890261E|nr:MULTISPECIES: phosphoethanolamine transferase [unclassified Duganella]SDH60310.1 Sulfatase [Duganella sp. OV458]SDJ42774.1 Sulfatase [Duganella sp. OV510]
MRSLLRPAPLFVLSSYLLLSLVPCVPLLLGKQVPELGHVLAVEALVWLAVWSLFGRPARFHWLLLPAFMALPTEIYLFIYYGQGISTHHLGIIAETSPKEALEFLGSKVWLMAAVLLAAVAWWIAVQVAAQRSTVLTWRGKPRWATLAIVILVAGVLAYGWEFGVRARPVPPAGASKLAPQHAGSAGSAIGSALSSALRFVGVTSAAETASEEESAIEDAVEASDPEYPAMAGAGHTGWPLGALPWRLRSPLSFGEFASSWPFGLTARGVDFYQEREYLADLGKRSSNFSFKAHQPAPNDTPEIVIMVIGESSRYDRWSVNGYARDTTPLLRQEANLVTLQDVITSVSATRLSVPVIISRKPAMQALKDGFSEKSFLTAYKEAGFKTFWLSNQISFGRFDTPVSVFAKEANVIQFMNLGGFTNNSNLDQILLEPLKHAIADAAPKKLIVLHTLGSHWNYSQRYPEDFDKWQPSLFGVDKPVYTDLKLKPQINNSYDNAILYTDWFLAQVIGQLKQTQQLASMVYVADHGQTLYDGTCNLAFHGHNTQFEFHVPAVVWYSDAFQAHYPDKVKQLLRHRKARLATENMFHTLLDMGNIQYDDEKLEWSFVSKQFKQHKRYVDSYGWSNYDNASFKGDCREVMDKGKPLKQEK